MKSNFSSDSIDNNVKSHFIENACLFIIDAQKGFISDHTREVLPRIVNLLGNRCFEHVVFTQFYNAANSPFQRILGWNKMTLAADQELAPEFDGLASVTFRKSIYSAVNPETLNYLMAHKINSVFIAGIDTDVCVLKTAVDFFEYGIHSFVLEYYSASNGGPDSHQCALRVIERLIGRSNIIRGPVDQERLKSRLYC
jgi:nicotinamidase-related amidase